MASFFDFIKKSNNNSSQTSSVQNTTFSGITGSQSYSGIGAPARGGQPYSGIGSLPTGKSYSGIGNPPKISKPATSGPSATTPQAKINLNQPPTGQINQNILNQNKDLGQSLSTNISDKKRSELDLLTHLTQRANRVFEAARLKAEELKNNFIDSEHLLYGLLTDGEIYKLLTELKIQPQIVEEELIKIYKQEKAISHPQLAPRAKRIIDESLITARKLGYEFISPEHILLALYEEGEGMGARILSKLGLKKEDINKKILGKKEGLATEEEIKKKKSFLEEYTIDLTAKAAQGLLDPVVERSDVIERVIHILSRRTKNNPALVGEAGVGKTAIVEGLAQKIASKQVPEPLLDKKILQLDLMNLLAGTSHRGEFEERMKNLIEEVKSNQGKVIVFIDEIQNIVGAGSSGEGSLDASNFLKPALARGEIQLIGATTLTEYRKYIEKDPALERRFQPVLVPEPTEEQAIKMLKAIKDKYEAFHRVKIPDEAIEAAVKYSKRYVGDRFLPDKAVDLIDEAASAVRLPLISLPEEIKSLETRISELTQEMKEAEGKKDRVKARIILSKIDDIQAQLNEKKDDYNQKKAQTTTAVSEELIKEIVSRWTGIPVSKITSSEIERLVNLEKLMHQRLINQESAVTAVAQAVRRGRAGLKSTQRPIGSFVFLGPTGVGKTELAKTLADILFGQEEAMIRFDMTEYMEKHEVAKLLGAPPGYVGYEEGGKLTEAVRRRPYSVVLFDEIEKAHPDIFNILLQILDDGRLTDNKGRVISFKNTVVICTSNIGTKLIQAELLKDKELEIKEKSQEEEEKDKNKFLAIKDKVMKELGKFFRPELINRFDDVIVFEPLQYSHMIEIVKLQLAGVGKLLEEQNIGFKYEDAAVKEIVQVGFDPIYGARPLRRAIQKLIENPISTLIIEGKAKIGDQIVVDFDGENFVFNLEKAEASEDRQPLWKKTFICQKCQYRFTTEIVKNSTIICPKCLSTDLKEAAKDEKKISLVDKKDDRSAASDFAQPAASAS
ncbi:MAG: ATP-dependent Clp protease ATP-binding subunit [Microgenomates group bacterium]|nr:ATP-dependent Clp protease ATP-binding subunit [Microgenomates group bacterium]